MGIWNFIASRQWVLMCNHYTYVLLKTWFSWLCSTYAYCDGFSERERESYAGLHCSWLIQKADALLRDRPRLDVHFLLIFGNEKRLKSSRREEQLVHLSRQGAHLCDAETTSSHLYIWCLSWSLCLCLICLRPSRLSSMPSAFSITIHTDLFGLYLSFPSPCLCFSALLSFHFQNSWSGLIGKIWMKKVQEQAVLSSTESLLPALLSTKCELKF